MGRLSIEERIEFDSYMQMLPPMAADAVETILSANNSDENGILEEFNDGLWHNADDLKKAQTQAAFKKKHAQAYRNERRKAQRAIAQRKRQLEISGPDI